MKLYTSQDLQMLHQYGSSHEVEKVQGTEVDLRQLKDNQSVIWGDGETFHYKLTYKFYPKTK